MVAPYVGAWIETITLKIKRQGEKSHPTWVRGLKQVCPNYVNVQSGSHPTWVRGLKLEKNLCSIIKRWGRTLRGCVD